MIAATFPRYSDHNSLRSHGKRRSDLTGIAAIAAALVLISTAAADEPRVTEQTVDAAVTKAVAYLHAKRNAGGNWDIGQAASAPAAIDRCWAGDSALVTLALLYAGDDPRSAEMAKTLDWLARQPIKGTYVYSLRAQCLALVPGEKYRRQLQNDMNWLVASAYRAGDNAGGYDYEAASPGAATGWCDNSNSQFGVLGAWMASEAGAISDRWQEYWKLVEQYWLRKQREDGGWNYKDSADSTASMTVAGLSSLYIVLDRMHARGGHKRSDPVQTALDRGLNWLADGYSAQNPPGVNEHRFYYYYGLERVGRASGRKFFREQDWFRSVAAVLLAEQKEDGSWGNGLRNTAFGLLFLCHGRAPIFMNKLEHADDWDVHMRDAAALTRHAQGTFERMLNWQSFALAQGTLDDLLESPILYLCGQSAWEFSDDEKAKLSEYVRRGGMLLAAAAGEDDPFAAAMKKLATDLFPDDPPRLVTREHPLVSGRVQFAFDRVPPLLEVHSGVRTLMLISLGNVAAAWNEGVAKKSEPQFQLGCNLYLYATDKTTIRSRLATPSIPLEPAEILRTVRVARIRHSGDWDIEPHGWERLATYMNNSSQTRLEVEHGVALDSPALTGFKVAHITGTNRLELSPAEIAGLRRFLNDGGTLLADAAMGSREFLQSFEAILADVLKTDATPLAPRDAILHGGAIPGAGKLDGMEYSRSVRAERRGREFPPLRAFTMGQRHAVVYSPLDLSVSLLGAHVWECEGYAPQAALPVARNMLLYANLSSAEKARLAAGR